MGSKLTWTQAAWDGEISWTIIGVGPYGAPSSSFTFEDLVPGTYTIEGFDSYGDGWNGASMTFVDIASGNSITLAVEGSSGSVDIEVTAGATLESSCDYASCSGCTDDTACNYDETALNDDGSCTFADDVFDCGDTASLVVCCTHSTADQYNDGMGLYRRLSVR